MSNVSPTIEGFRAAFRRPSLTFAEIAWRWSLGAAAWALFLFYSIEYLDTLPVTNADAALLATRQPSLVGRAIAHILRGSLNRAVLAALLAVLALSILWIVAASVGRLGTVRVLLAYFRRDVADSAREDAAIGVSTKAHDPAEPRPIRALIDLNFLRVAVVLAVMLALAGAAILASFVSSKASPRPGLVFTMFVPLAGIVCMAGWALNWWLSFAAVFAVRNGEDALGALSTAVTFFRERTGAVVAVSTWTGLAHLVVFSMATTAASLPLSLIPVAPSRLVIAGVVLVTLAYFAVADWLYMARLAGYVCIAEMPDALPATAPFLPASPGGTVAPVATAIDRDEPILSDIPNLAVET
ncbi:MAG: hypothetical protein WCA49_22690 [Candidatus Sulfotelmatobacter sp.]